MDIFKSYIEGHFVGYPKFCVGDLIKVNHLGVTRPPMILIKATRGFGIIMEVREIEKKPNSNEKQYSYYCYFQESMEYVWIKEDGLERV